MTQKERLVDLLKTVPTTIGGVIDMETVAKYADAIIDIEQIADYLLQNGVIVPPCKVGDTVYKIGYTPCTKYGEDPYSSLCEGCMIPCDSHLTIVTHVAPTNAWIVSEFIDKAKQYQYYFLTREAANRALKEREKHE